MQSRKVLLLLGPLVAFAEEPTVVQVQIGSEVLSKVLPEYLSIDIDFWHNTTHDCGKDQGDRCWGDAGALWLDLKHPLLISAVSALTPGFIRFGGSLDNVVKYLVGNMTSDECNAPVYAKRQYWYKLCLNMTRWDEIQHFAHNTGHRIIFGLSYQYQGAAKQWSPTNVLDFLSYTAASKVVPPVLYGVEFGEEMAPQPSDSAFESLVDAYGQLRENIAELWPDLAMRPKVLGPCVGMQNEVPGSGFGFTKAFLNRTITEGVLDAVVIHSYNNDGGDSWQRAGFLSQTLAQAENMLQESRKHSSTIGLWCGECGPHNTGGLENITDRFISSFWYADALGGLAKAGLVEFGRQALVGGNYGMLQMGSFEPNPDFYTAVLWKMLMGQEVLGVKLSVAQAGVDALESLRVYAHCSTGSAARDSSRRTVTLLFINVDENRSFSLMPTQLLKEVASGSDDDRLEYHITATASPQLLSKTVSVNGKPLVVKDNTLPLDDLKPIVVGSTEPIMVAPLSYGFAVLAGFECPGGSRSESII